MYAAVLVFAFGSALVFGSYGIATVALVFLPVATSWAKFLQERVTAHSRCVTRSGGNLLIWFV